MSLEQRYQRGITTSAVLSLLGWALSKTPHTAGPNRIMPTSHSKARRVKGSTGKGGMSPTNFADLKVRPPNPLSVPRSISGIQNQVVRDVVKIQSTITTSSSGIVETNYSWSLNSHPQASSWQALFDQWCLYQVTTQFNSQLAPGSTTPACMFYSALDFDNSANVGSVAAIEDFSSAEAVMMFPQASTMRSVRPSPKMAVGAISSAPSAAVTGPQWLDSSIPGIIHFGIRTVSDVSPSAQFITVTTTLWFAFRNSI